MMAGVLGWSNHHRDGAVLLQGHPQPFLTPWSGFVTDDSAYGRHDRLRALNGVCARGSPHVKQRNDLKRIIAS
ncbi:hypothetical protein HMPREF0290_0763 [Corynebacterium efficiens YS-314]|nr:hypothetical protein HMPREF0290_0763 [Corynebacterium efficiens YS-314]